MLSPAFAQIVALEKQDKTRPSEQHRYSVKAAKDYRNHSKEETPDTIQHDEDDEKLVMLENDQTPGCDDITNTDDKQQQRGQNQNQQMKNKIKNKNNKMSGNVSEQSPSPNTVVTINKDTNNTINNTPSKDILRTTTPMPTSIDREKVVSPQIQKNIKDRKLTDLGHYVWLINHYCGIHFETEHAYYQWLQRQLTILGMCVYLFVFMCAFFFMFAFF